MPRDFTIQNRNNENIVLTVEEPQNVRGLAFVMHGFAGFRSQKHIRTFVDAFLAEGFRVVSFDATNANGESDGSTALATMDTYVDDLEDVVAWAKNQTWFVSPFALCGHSMGAQSVAWYASQHSGEVSLLLPMAPMVNYDLRMAVVSEEQKKIFEESGRIELPSASKPGLVNVFTKANHESLRNYDLLTAAKNITVPVLDIVGEKDEPCPVKHQQLFIGMVASEDKTLEIIPNVDHNYRAHEIDQTETLGNIGKIMRDWLSKHS